MVAAVEMADITGQRRSTIAVGPDAELSPDHTVGHSLDRFLERQQIPRNGLRWMAVSRGLRLDNKSRLADLPEEDARWSVLPEVSAGTGGAG